VLYELSALSQKVWHTPLNPFPEPICFRTRNKLLMAVCGTDFASLASTKLDLEDRPHALSILTVSAVFVALYADICHGCR
jgi:hypothetical protein